METFAVYWEPKPKTYGFKEVIDLSLLNIEIRPGKMTQWGLWLMELSDLDIGFHLILAKYSTHQKLRLYILLEKLWEDRVLSYLGKKIDAGFRKRFSFNLSSGTHKLSGSTFWRQVWNRRYGI